jgi:hypothetical protein
MIDLFIPSYHRPDNLKTVNLFLRLGWEPSKITVFIDDETDDIGLYKVACENYGCNLHVFSMKEARKRFDYVHRPSVSRRSAGQARNMFQDYARVNGVDFYVVQDDDSSSFEIKRFGRNAGRGDGELVRSVFESIEKFMRKRKIGVFGLSQSGDYIGGENKYYFIRKVMNTTFYLLPYIYRGERGVQDNDTSQYVGLWNEGYFTGSCADGLILHQMPSATQKGGLTENYIENKLLNKSLVTVIQFPSAIRASKQIKNGGRLHHLITYRNLGPRILRIKGGNDNIAWDTYPEDVPFTNEPKR